MIVSKKINNNVVICKDSNHKELIAFGKGIGFPPTPYELTDLSKIERTFYDVGSQYISLLNDIPYEIIQFTAQQILKTQNKLNYDTNANLILTLSDHIAFAIERVKKGIYIRMPSIYELELNYPVEVKIGREFISEILQEFKIKLPKSEAHGIAMHFINAKDYSQIEEPAYVKQLEQHYEEILQETTCIIEQEMGIQVRKDTFNYVRFATHIQYLLKRLYEQKYIESSNLQMYKSLQDEFQEISDCVDKICEYYNDIWSLMLPDEEKLYLIIHINRVCSKNVL